MVYHIKDGTTLSLTESTSNGNNFTNSGATATTGKIDGGANLVKTSFQKINTTSNFVIPTTGTVSFWAKCSVAPDGTTGNKQPFITQRISAPIRTFDLYIYQGGGTFGWYNNGVDKRVLVTLTGTILANVWYYYTLTWTNGGTTELRINNVQTGTPTTGLNTTYSTSTLPTSIGWDTLGGVSTANDYFSGQIDEIRFSDVVRPSSWITAEYNNQNSPSTFYNLSSEVAIYNLNYKRAITIDYTKCGTVNSTDFPVLVSFTDVNFKSVANGGKVQNANGYDIKFYSDAGLTNQLFWEIEKYVPTTGECIFWVKVPTLSASANTIIYVSYGNNTITTFQSTATSVWNSNFNGVWHFPNGTTLTANDSTLNSYNGSLVSTPTATTGKIDGGINLNGTNQAVDFGQVALTETSATYSFWVNFSSISTQQRLALGWGGSSASLWLLNIGLRSTTDTIPSSGNARMTLRVYDLGTGGSTNNRIYGGTNFTTNTWYHVAITGNATTYKIYVNAIAESLTAGVGINNGRVLGSLTKAGTGKMAIGTTYYSNAYDFGSAFSGGLDELKVSNVERSSSWITSEYNNQNSPSTFFTLGNEIITPTISNISTTTGIQTITL
jgi:hypothetical protein